MISDGKKELAFMARTVREAWKACGGAELNTREKGAFDLVTDVDLAMENFIDAAIKENFPSDIVVGEELAPLREMPPGRAWTVDPVDGTVNMAHGLPLFGVQCSFAVDGLLRAAVIYLPRYEEMYAAVKGSGAMLNGVPIRVSGRSAEDAVISVGDYSHKTEAHAKGQIARVGYLYDRVSKLRHFGAASVDFAWFASGRTDAFMMYTRNLWDILPGWLIAEEAGGIALSVNGGPYRSGEDGIVVCASSSVAELFREAAEAAKGK